MSEPPLLDQDFRLARFVVDHATIAIIWSDVEGRILYTNEETTRILGYEPGELVGKTYFDIVPTGNATNVPRRLGEIVERGTIKWEGIGRHRDGHEVPVDVTASLVTFAGTPLVVMFAQDITARRRSEERLQQARFIVEHATDAIYQFDDQGTILYTNDVASRMLGYSEEELRGKTIRSFLPPEERSGNLERIKRIMTLGQATFRSRHQRKDGSIFPVNVAARRVDVGNRTYLVGFARDISVEVADEAAFRRESMLNSIVAELASALLDRRAVLDNVMDLLLDRIARLTDAAYGLVGTIQPPGDVLEGRQWMPGVPPDGQRIESFRVASAGAHAGPWGWLPELQRPVLSNSPPVAGGAKTAFEIRNYLIVPVKYGGTTQGCLAVANSSRPLVDDDLRCLSRLGDVFALAIDLRAREAERQVLEEAFHQAQRVESIGRLAGGIAHDFNNLLTPILGHADLALEDARVTSVRTALRAIKQAAQRGRTMTRQFLAIGRRAVFKRQVVDLTELLDRMALLLRRTLRDDIELVVRLPANVGAVTADPSQVEQVLMNLIMNAQDAMPRGGILTLTAGEEEPRGPFASGGPPPPGRYLAIGVRDTGDGMSEDVLRKAFDPFFTTKPKEHGSGLGLPTSDGIVRQHGGAIAVTTSPGVGAEFRVYLPRTDAAPPAPPSSERPDPRLAGRARTILVVDDEPTVREIAAAALTRFGHKTIVAESPEDALRKVEHDRVHPDLLLTDVVMPRIRGNELYRRLRTLLPELRVVYMSGYAEGFEPGGKGRPRAFSLVKPFTISELKREVNAAFRTPARRGGPGRKPAAGAPRKRKPRRNPG